MTALVTGGTAGIGWHIASALAEAGHDVVITGRDADRGTHAAARIGARFHRVEHATIGGNRELARWWGAQGLTLDVLVNNVGGAAAARRTITADGIESILALNYVGAVTLTDALLPHLAADAHVVNVASSAFLMHKGDPFTETHPHVAIKAYARAKQLLVLATMSLARRLTDQAYVNAVNPGMAWTPGTQALTPATVPAWRYIWPLVRLVQRRASPEKAARAPLTLALRPAATGRYVKSNGTEQALPRRLTDPGLQDRAWQWALHPPTADS